MLIRIWIVPLIACVCFVAYLVSLPANACCPAYPSGKPVVNADQTVVIIWDAKTKTQHFIRQASFKSEADDFGFLVPSPTQPELDESGNGAFDALRKLTEPEIKKLPRGKSDKKDAKEKKSHAPESVKVLEQKLVAGFNAAVLETKSAAALVKWLKENGYTFRAVIFQPASTYGLAHASTSGEKV